MNIQTRIPSHIEIIEKAGGYKSLADSLNLPREKVRFWERRKSIPPSYWADVESLGLASASQLSTAQKRQSA